MVTDEGTLRPVEWTAPKRNPPWREGLPGGVASARPGPWSPAHARPANQVPIGGARFRGKPTFRRSRPGFTVIELLVVTVVLGILASLLIPTLSQGKFRGRVVVCSNNFRQLAVASVLYADSDGLARLPAHLLPTESSQLANFDSLYPWIMAVPTLSALSAHGIRQPELWFCPLRSKWRDVSRSYRAALGKPLATVDDLTAYYTRIQGTKYAFPDLNWWVPRPLEGAPSVTYPDVALLATRQTAPWPARLTDPTIAVRPIASDWLMGGKNAAGDGLASGGGAHEFGGQVRNCNSGFADGHVETRPAPQIKWELRLNQPANGYVFY